MQTRSIDLDKNKSVPVPAGWTGVGFVMQSSNTVLVSRTQPLAFSELRTRLKKAKVRFTPAQISREIRAYRRARHARRPR